MSPPLILWVCYIAQCEFASVMLVNKLTAWNFLVMEVFNATSIISTTYPRVLDFQVLQLQASKTGLEIFQHLSSTTSVVRNFVELVLSLTTLRIRGVCITGYQQTHRFSNSFYHFVKRVVHVAANDLGFFCMFKPYSSIYTDYYLEFSFCLALYIKGYLLTFL